MDRYDQTRPFYDRKGDSLGRRRSALRAGCDPVTGKTTEQSPATVGRSLKPRRLRPEGDDRTNRDRLFD